MSYTDLVVLFGLQVLAFWHRERPLYIFAGLAAIYYGFMFYSRSTEISIVLVAWALYILTFKAWLENKRARGD
jgi:hypothetical protein